MINIKIIDILIDWTFLNFGFSLLTILYPTAGVFRSDSLFAIEYAGGKFYLEIFFFTIIGEKQEPIE